MSERWLTLLLQSHTSAEPYHYLHTLLINSESIFIYFPCIFIHIGVLFLAHLRLNISLGLQARFFFSFLLLICSRRFLSVVGCLHFISLYVYLLCVALFLLWHNVYCWVHARNQYSILIVLYGELIIIITYTTKHHRIININAVSKSLSSLFHINNSVCRIFFIFCCIFALFFQSSMWFLFFIFLRFFLSHFAFFALPNHF